jgi:methionine-S-sulfoxide reductase
MRENEKAIFAAGCFWGVQSYFDQVPGVTRSIVGYTGGHTENPTYEDVCTHTTGHAEAVLLEYDPQKISYEDLCRHFFRMHDPTQLNRQGWDIGDSYRSAILYFDDEQRQTALMVKTEIEPNFDKPIVTQLSPASTFYEAEDYHQKYTEKTGRGTCHVEYAPLR